MKTTAAPFKVGSAALITTLEELDAALANGYPSAGGFSQGFTMHRDADGVCQQSGRWGHEQCCVGRRRRNGRRQYLLGQSWGLNVPDGPLTDDQPNFSFWIDETPMASILSQRDWLAFAKFPGSGTQAASRRVDDQRLHLERFADALRGGWSQDTRSTCGNGDWLGQTTVPFRQARDGPENGDRHPAPGRPKIRAWSGPGA